MSASSRWRGLAALFADGVENGSRAIERVQLETAQRWFGVLEHIPPIATAARGLHMVHVVCVSSTHGVIRGVTRAVGAAATLDHGRRRR
jgi:hypothetical protein